MHDQQPFPYHYVPLTDEGGDSYVALACLHPDPSRPREIEESAIDLKDSSPENAQAVCEFMNQHFARIHENG